MVGFTRARRARDFVKKLQEFTLPNSVWHWGLVALECACAPPGPAPPGPAGGARSRDAGPSAARGKRLQGPRAPLRCELLKSRRTWHYQGVLQSIDDVIYLACTNHRGGVCQLPPALANLPLQLTPPGCVPVPPVSSERTEDAGADEPADDGADGPDEPSRGRGGPKRPAAALGNGAGPRRSERGKSKAQRERAAGAAAASKRRRLATAPHTVVDLTGHTVSVVPAAVGDDSAVGQRRVHFKVDTEMSMVPPSDEAALQDALNHIACVVHMHDLMLSASEGDAEAARRAEIQAMVLRFRSNDSDTEGLVARVLGMLRVCMPYC